MTKYSLKDPNRGMYFGEYDETEQGSVTIFEATNSIGILFNPTGDLCDLGEVINKLAKQIDERNLNYNYLSSQNVDGLDPDIITFSSVPPPNELYFKNPRSPLVFHPCNPFGPGKIHETP